MAWSWWAAPSSSPPSFCWDGGRDRERFTAVSSVDRLMLSELYRQEEQVCLVLRRSDRMPLQAIGNLEGLLGETLDRLRETMDALFSGLDRPVGGADFWRKYENWDGLRDLCREMKMSSGQWLRLTARRTADGMEDLLIFRASPRSASGMRNMRPVSARRRRPVSSRPASSSGCPTRSAPP